MFVYYLKPWHADWIVLSPFFCFCFTFTVTVTFSVLRIIHQTPKRTGSHIPSSAVAEFLVHNATVFACGIHVLHILCVQGCNTGLDITCLSVSLSTLYVETSSLTDSKFTDLSRLAGECVPRSPSAGITGMCTALFFVRLLENNLSSSYLLADKHLLTNTY